MLAFLSFCMLAGSYKWKQKMAKRNGRASVLESVL